MLFYTYYYTYSEKFSLSPKIIRFWRMSNTFDLLTFQHYTCRIVHQRKFATIIQVCQISSKYLGPLSLDHSLIRFLNVGISRNAEYP